METVTISLHKYEALKNLEKEIKKRNVITRTSLCGGDYQYYVIHDNDNEFLLNRVQELTTSNNELLKSIEEKTKTINKLRDDLYRHESEEIHKKIAKSNRFNFRFL